MSTLTIHIGSHKTGTTSIQKACRVHLAKGGATDLRYFDVRPTGIRVVRTYGKGKDFGAEVLPEIADQVFRPEQTGKPVSENTRFFTSDEGFFWINEPETVHLLAEMLKERFASVGIVCYLRRQDRLAVSHRKQVLGDRLPASRFYGIDTGPLPTYRDHLHSYFDYATKLSTIWASAFGRENIQVIPYERSALEGGDVVEDFAHRSGARFSLKKPMRSNIALDGDKVLVGMKLAELNVPKPLRDKIMDTLPGTGRYLPTRADAQAFLANFADNNERLAQDWTWKGEPFRFDDSFDMYPETTDAQWGNSDVERILDAVLRAKLAAK